MNVTEYLQTKLSESSDYALTVADKELIKKFGIEEYIFKKLLSKKFRKWSLSETVQDSIKEKIHNCVAAHLPIQLTLSYGGFKLWRLPTTPEVDWSEFFYISHHIKYMAPIAAAYTPGINLDFSSGDIAVTTMNNVPREDVDQYDTSLRKLIDTFKPYLPYNCSIGASRLRDLFDSEEQFIEEGEKLRESARKTFAVDAHLADEFRRGAIQNVQLVGGREDLSQLSEDELNEYRNRAAEIVFAMYGTPQIAAREKHEGIALMSTNIDLPIPMITTGATKYSTAKFWAGLGVLTHNADGYADYVLTPKQWENIRKNPHETIATDLIPLSKTFLKFLSTQKNFLFKISKN